MTAVALALIQAVHAAGGTITLDGPNLQLEAPAPLPDPLRASLRQHKPAVVAFLAEQAANANEQSPAAVAAPMPPAEPGPWSAGIPDEVARGLGAIFMAAAARGIPDHHWPTIVTDSLALVDSGQAAQAFALGWTAADLFGCDQRAAGPFPRSPPLTPACATATAVCCASGAPRSLTNRRWRCSGICCCRSTSGHSSARRRSPASNPSPQIQSG